MHSSPKRAHKRGGGDAVHAGAGLGDDALLAHAPRQQDLAEHIVDLVRAGVIELLALEIDFGAAARKAGGLSAMRGQPLGEIERRRAADIMRQIAVHFFLERRIGLCLRVSFLQFAGSAASASRRQSGRHRCRNARARPARCGTNWVAATVMQGS